MYYLIETDKLGSLPVTHYLDKNKLNAILCELETSKQFWPCFLMSREKGVCLSSVLQGQSQYPMLTFLELDGTLFLPG